MEGLPKLESKDYPGTFHVFASFENWKEFQNNQNAKDSQGTRPVWDEALTSTSRVVPTLNWCASAIRYAVKRECTRMQRNQVPLTREDQNKMVGLCVDTLVSENLVGVSPDNLFEQWFGRELGPLVKSRVISRLNSEALEVLSLIHI